ncbi:MAG TPA: MFS transporter [Candidatus Limnocylindrales bacterium]|nr:MFS transporter [Candidatus Limnocylindrales bacterium]
MSRDARLLFAARAVRMFGYGSLAVILVLFLAASGFDGGAIGLLLSLTLVGDTFVSLWLTTHADRIGRRRTLIVGAILMAGAGAIFASETGFLILVVAATIGVLSPSGNEVGPFLAIEQASLSQVSDQRRRTSIFAWYNLTGSVATAVGALMTGLAVSFLRGGMSMAELSADRVVLLGYAVVGLVLIPLFLAVSPAVEVPPVDTSIARRLGLHKSRGIVFRLAALFTIDAFAGGFVIQSLLAFWFHTRFGVSEAVLGGIFFGANILAAVSALSAARIAARIGLINTMVFTHLPSNVLLILVPLMPNLPLAILVLLARFSISQMDVPTRQSYTIAVVDPDERSAAAGVTGIARTTGAAISPLIASPLMVVPALAAVPFFIAGGLKIVYDLLLYRAFKARPAPEEARGVGPATR